MNKELTYAQEEKVWRAKKYESIDYEITTEGDFSYKPYSNVICIGMSSKVYDEISETELSEYIADSLTHEHVHHILFREFNITVTKLFDVVQQYFRNVHLHEKIINIHRKIDSSSFKITHEKFIKVYGIINFFMNYGISDNDLRNARILCNYRV